MIFCCCYADACAFQNAGPNTSVSAPLLHTAGVTHLTLQTYTSIVILWSPIIIRMFGGKGITPMLAILEPFGIFEILYYTLFGSFHAQALSSKSTSKLPWGWLGVYNSSVAPSEILTNRISRNTYLSTHLSTSLPAS